MEIVTHIKYSQQIGCFIQGLIICCKMNNEKVEVDVRLNKIKEGVLLKQSRHLKEWKERWIVLTKTHLYSFSEKGQYKNPTESIFLKDVQTLKSYYKDQYKQFTFRVESHSVNLHMSTKTAEEKWAWMTAIEKMVERGLRPETKGDAQNIIRQTLKMSTAVRQTMLKKQQKNQQNSDFSDSLMKKLKLSIQNSVNEHHILPSKVSQVKVESNNVSLSQQQETFFILNKKSPAQKNPTEVTDSIVEKDQKVTEVVIQQKIVQKIVEVPVIVEKVVKVPEIRQKIVEKIVYREVAGKSDNKSLTKSLKSLMLNAGDNPSPLVNFVVYLLTSNLEQYQPDVLQFCLDKEAQRFFSEVFLLMMNEETEEQNLNRYLKFIYMLYHSSDQYFYSSDVKALISMLIRQIEMNRSEVNQTLILMVLRTFAEKKWWVDLNYRRGDLKAIIKQIEAISGPENQFLASNLLEII